MGDVRVCFCLYSERNWDAFHPPSSPSLMCGHFYPSFLSLCLFLLCFASSLVNISPANLHLQPSPLHLFSFFSLFFFCPTSFSYSAPQSGTAQTYNPHLPSRWVCSRWRRSVWTGRVGVGGSQASWKLPLWRQRLRQKGTLFTWADTHTDTKTPGSGISFSLSPRLAGRAERKRQLNPAFSPLFVCLFIYLMMPHPGLIRVVEIFLWAHATSNVARLRDEENLVQEEISGEFSLFNAPDWLSSKVVRFYTLGCNATPYNWWRRKCIHL